MLQGLSTEAFARRSARRPWITIGLWVVTLVAAFMLDSLVKTRFEEVPAI